MLLDVKNLKTEFITKKGTISAVNGMDFNIKKGEVVALVGESGSGKSVTSLSIMRLHSKTSKTKISGEILFKSENLLEKSEKDMQNLRGKNISMIFQEPMTSLNPVFTIGKQINEAVMKHTGCNKKEARKKSIEMLNLVGIPSPEKRIDCYPHQLSGGMRQRVMIAMALSCNPELLIADEPTTALDVTIQAQILELMLELKEKLNTSILLITHDLGVVAEVADRVVVMYCGKVVEKASVTDIFSDPKHPYTKGLLSSIPKLDEEVDKLFIIPGTVPNPLELPTGCAFRDRCEKCIEKCATSQPPLISLGNREVRCFLYGEKKEAK
ncbi:ABC transporter ATP-binding protein [Clostridium botulinum]|uniref:ABC transporter ATP-binding protein n=1 Tax=Clostridium botulinum TaxID=1491 RepID=UPI0013F0E5BC|nr:ABC transporter ATP-binding protein [Clostridium botulinum]MBN1042113.1 ABC transporter ATP-binding protein [Clostridium botulinum]MBN1071240.1 ABC transporter ATP-binding protein [Clostridium botulinum]MBY6916167.1 ABC transporter ATP-binding protein [Clostridium botulinum]NFL34855.1 ABC transporter ATP-binding protein [Clostridium botulinum]NFM02763.1 ABC transporter ATP-binding protein [Clostridium botulinum]